MSDIKSSPVNPQTALKPNQMLAQGRISRVTRFEGQVETTVITPAPDAYSKPSQMRIQSPFKLGEAGDDVKVLVAYNGWPNVFNGKDGEKVHDTRGYFVAVD